MHQVIKKEFVRFIDDDNKMIEYIKNYFKKKLKNQKLGELIEKEINGKIFDDDIITSIYSYANKYSKIISPKDYQKISQDIALFVFIIIDILEYIGLTNKGQMQ